MPNQVNPLNPFARVVRVMTLDPATGQLVPKTSGTPPTGFFAPARLPTAQAPDPALIVAGVYIGNQPGFQAGDWLLYFAPATLTEALLDLLATSRPFFIYELPGAHRVYEELVYAKSRAATVVP